MSRGQCACRFCGRKFAGNTNRRYCDDQCRVQASLKRRGVANGDCPYCLSRRMPLQGEFHMSKDGRRYRCGVWQTQPPQQIVDGADSKAGDVHAQLEAAIAREMDAPWERHPEPWDNVRVRRRPRMVTP